MIGEFEYLLIATASRLGEAAYGASMRQHLETVMGRPCSIGALYTTLDRLEAKGLVRTWMGEATRERGGRAKRMVEVTPAGVHAAREFYETVQRASAGTVWSAADGGRRA